MMPANTWIQRAIRLSHSLMVGLIIIFGVRRLVAALESADESAHSKLLTSAIRRISKRTQQKRHMIMLISVFDFKNDGDLWIEGWDVIAGEICTRIEDETIHASLDRGFVRHQIRKPSIRMCRSFAKQNPATRSF